MSQPASGFGGFCILLGVAVVLAGCGGALVALHIVGIGELVGVLVVGVILVAAASPRRSNFGPQNTYVHGASRPASQIEIQNAARGDLAQQPAHKQQFPD